MKRTQPRGLSRRRVGQLLSKAKHFRSAASRIEIISRLFLGYPYKSNPLIGSADTAEVFTACLDGFDCVTFIETTLALARASSVDDYTECLRTLRYEHGLIRWDRRNHYMTDWIRNSVREQLISPVSMAPVPIISREKVLNVVPGLAARRTRVKCAPKRGILRLAAHLQTGDLVFFASTRKNLDVFHAGIIVRQGDKVFMRHASRSRGCVVEQELSEFLKANRMAGVMVMRPRDDADRITAARQKSAFPSMPVGCSHKKCGATRRDAQ
jgi:N-acetylmuramoyl-L-alanine amidase-like